MILIVDSGSTKSDWLLVESGKVKNEFFTMGFNPFFHDAAAISHGISDNKELIAFSEYIDVIYYYGAGCSSPSLCEVVKNGLKTIFIKAEIFVDHDLAACAYATYTGVPAISCILGTGSNSCHFDGNSIFQAVPSLAYILGDEASGSYFGKKLFRAYLYRQLPRQLNEAYEQEIGLSKDQIFDRVYGQPHANVFLASFMEFIYRYKADPFLRNMLVEGISEFFSVHVVSYDDHKSVPVHFVGSIAHYFEDELTLAAERYNINIGQIVRKPILGILNYHKYKGDVS